MQNKKKRIIYLRTDLGTKDLIGGGSVAHTLGVINGLNQLGHDLFIVSSAMHKLLQHAIQNVTLLHMPAWLKPFGFKLNALISNIIFYLKSIKIIKKNNVNLIYQRYSMLNCVGVWLSASFNIPLFLEFNGSEVWVDKHWSKGRKLHLSWLIEKVEKFNLNHADTIIVVSQVLKEQLIDRGIDEQKIKVNPNGVDINQFNPHILHDERMALRKSLNIQDRCVFGFSGTFGPWHGVELLGDIIPRVVRKNKNVHFLLIGDGLLRKTLYTMLKYENVLDNVTFVGMINSEQVPAYLSSCDAFLCPTQSNRDGTRFFGSPTKLFEYMAMAKPIIASDIEQLAELLYEQKKDHLLIAPDDIDGFVHAIEHVVNMQLAQRNEIGNRLQQQVIQNFTWKSHVERFCK
ncbi:MAG: glycosyltransferase family 4 protein [Candidatus Dependentiae bacterium]